MSRDSWIRSLALVGLSLAASHSWAVTISLVPDGPNITTPFSTVNRFEFASDETSAANGVVQRVG